MSKVAREFVTTVGENAGNYFICGRVLSKYQDKIEMEDGAGSVTTISVLEKKTVCAGPDWDMPVESDKYRLVTANLEDWIDPKEWLSEFRNDIKFFLARGGRLEWGETHVRKLLTLQADYQVACLDLLNVKEFRSEFRASLRKQLDAWLNGTSHYDQPFTQRQWDCLVTSHVIRKRKNADRQVYVNQSGW